MKKLLPLHFIVALVMTLLVSARAHADNAKPNDYVFAYDPETSLLFEIPVFIVTDEEIYKKSGALSDTAPPPQIQAILASLGFAEIMESYYEYVGGDPEVGRAALLDAGFDEDLSLVYADKKPQPKDYCFAVLGFEGDGGPVFVVVDEEKAATGPLVGPPPSLLPAGFVASPYSTIEFEYQGPIAPGTAALLDAGFEACPEIL